jgi:hypothetical protein
MIGQRIGPCAPDDDLHEIEAIRFVVTASIFFLNQLYPEVHSGWLDCANANNSYRGHQCVERRQWPALWRTAVCEESLVT